MIINDSHCHFFSTQFLATLARQRGRSDARAPSPLPADELLDKRLADEVCGDLDWDAPGSAYTLADTWVRELDAHDVRRAALIASIPSDETSVAAAVARHPDRFVGFFMLDPASPDPAARVRRAIGELGLRAVCLFPAMNHVPLDDARVQQVVEAVAAYPGAAVFVHCGVLSVGVRRRLRLP